MSRQQNFVYLHEAVVKHVPEAQRMELEKYLQQIMGNESSGDRYAKNDNSSATGIFQFIKSTWNQYSPGKDIYDPKEQCDAAVRFALDNGKALEKVLGRKPTAGEYYLAHFAGTGGARALLKENDDTPISQVLEHNVFGANSNIQFDGKYFGMFTVGDIKKWADKKMGVEVGAYSNGASGPEADSLIDKIMELFVALIQGILNPKKSVEADHNSIEVPKLTVTKPKVEASYQLATTR